MLYTRVVLTFNIRTREGKTMKRNINIKRSFFILMSLLITFSLFVSCEKQEGVNEVTFKQVGVRGTVIDETGAPIPNATIVINKKQEAVLTNEKGDFYIDIPSGEQLLTIYNDNIIHTTVAVDALDGSFVELNEISPEGFAQTSVSGANLSSSKFDCGAWGQNNCTKFDWAFGNAGFGFAQRCDRGLECRSTDVLGLNCSIGEGVCRNDDRWQDKARSVKKGWAYNAIVEQRKIARYEPLNWTAMIGAHNAYNNYADGYVIKPNQEYSMTDQLNMGARVLMLDVHHICAFKCEIRLSHASINKYGHHVGASSGDRHFGFGIIEIKQWLDKNPGEVIILDMEEKLEGNAESIADYAWVLEHFLGGTYKNRKDYMLRQSDLPDGEGRSNDKRWPTLQEIRDMGKQVVLKGGGPLHHLNKDYIFSKVKTTFNLNKPLYFNPESCKISDQSFTDSLERFAAVEESRYIFDFSIFGTAGNEYEDTGVIAEDCSGTGYPCAEISEITACGNSQVLLDFISDPAGRNHDDYASMGNRFTGLVWSWKEGVRGWEKDNQAAVLETSSGRWVPREPSETYHYACGHLREGVPSTWSDSTQSTEWKWADRTQLTEWRVTQEFGPYRDGGMHCAKEFGPEFVFSVPVNAPQNKALIDTSYNDVWLAYRDIKDEEGEINWDRDVPCITGVSASSTELWPPNHKMLPVGLDVLHQCKIEPHCKVSSISSDDPTATDDDWKIILDEEIQLAVELRSEREGLDQDGRTYSIEIECVVDKAGRVNTTAVDILVPHDQSEYRYRAGPQYTYRPLDKGLSE